MSSQTSFLFVFFFPLAFLGGSQKLFLLVGLFSLLSFLISLASFFPFLSLRPPLFAVQVMFHSITILNKQLHFCIHGRYRWLFCFCYWSNDIPSFMFNDCSLLFSTSIENITQSQIHPTLFVVLLLNGLFFVIYRFTDFSHNMSLPLHAYFKNNDFLLFFFTFWFILSILHIIQSLSNSLITCSTKIMSIIDSQIYTITLVH